MARAGRPLATRGDAALPAAPPRRPRPARAGGALSWLAFDTASDRASVALGRTASDALTEELAGARRHAGQLLPMITRLLDRAGIGLDRLSGVLVSDGPGSFTGLRVGASVAKALAHARRLPVWTAPSLMVRAAAHADAGVTVLAISDALRGEVYAGAYRFPAGRVETLLAPSVWKPDALVAATTRPALVVGDGPPASLERLAAWSGRPVVGPPEGAPRAALLLELRRRAGGALQVDDVEQWEPDYGRPAEAQARWEQVHGRPLPDPAGDAG
ncbi:MAG TPA: tRNA (adenosine(37)-N6)-threonylcarbamoyltransferase complex dimerization subunit type 1 TsaB [Gemmatimonadales bacterium]|nr:tRNA (adenosine(37)-N6)-threonylcarbamoyltransferase complex dimerization subunit type 1 TsaB [Gemmatimonadales bacterium]